MATMPPSAKKILRIILGLAPIAVKIAISFFLSITSIDSEKKILMEAISRIKAKVRKTNIFSTLTARSKLTCCWSLLSTLKSGPKTSFNCCCTRAPIRRVLLLFPERFACCHNPLTPGQNLRAQKHNYRRTAFLSQTPLLP